MRKTLITYFHNIRMAYALGHKIPGEINNRFGYWDFENYMTFKKDDFNFKISEDKSLFGFHKVFVFVDDILIYHQDSWIHSVPKEMKIKVEQIINVLKEYNNQCNKNKLTKSYNQYLIQKEIEKKQKEKRKREEEKRYLIEKFK